MSTNALKREVARMRRKTAVWEALWVQFWRLPGAWANAVYDVKNDCHIQSRADRALLYIEDEGDISEDDRMVTRALLVNSMRAETHIYTCIARQLIEISLKEISREQLDQLPKFVKKRREECDGDHRGLTKRLRQAYQFTAHGDVLQDDRKRRDASRSSVPSHGEPDRGNQRKLRRSMAKSDDVLLFPQFGDILPIRYPKEIMKEVKETLSIFTVIERKIMRESITIEYIEEKRKTFYGQPKEYEKFCKSTLDLFIDTDTIEPISCKQMHHLGLGKVKSHRSPSGA